MQPPQPLQGIADKLVQYCRSNDEASGLNELYAENAVSIEAVDFSGQGRESQGLDAIRGKHEWWYGAHEVHSSSVDGPFLHGENQFSLIFDMDVTEKASGQRSQMKETATYTIENDKIVKEEFFYALG